MSELRATGLIKRYRQRTVVDAVGARAHLYDEGPLVELHNQVRGRHDPIERRN